PLAERKYVPDDNHLHHETTTEHPGDKAKGHPGADERHRQQQQHGRLTKYVRSLKWTPIPLGVGFALLAYQHYRRVIRRANDPASRTGGGAQLAKNWEVTCYRMVPLRAFSRAWGWVHSINLPVWARAPLYSDAFNCNVGEAEIEDLQYYRNLGEFFRRGLKTGVRPICNQSAVVSPVDGTVLQCGKVECGNVEQVKGVSYSLPTFLGPHTWANSNNNDDVIINQAAANEQYCSGLMKNKGTALYHCVIYLAPGDYHRFHSPVEWKVQFRRHFAGELLSVNPVVARWIAGLFSLNERAVYVGEWEHGFFSYTAVGATNVGSIRVYDDKELSTNCWRLKKNTFIDKKFNKPLALQKGDNFGEFNLGSTIVLLFEAPLDFEFAAENGSKIHLGESLFKSKERLSPPPQSSPQSDENPSL
ncbi:Phosphatidylserine decarboxylase proenzyme, partial [Orchesella cincta]